MGVTVGMDLGTSFSSVAVALPGEIRVLSEQGGEERMPSAVSITGSGILVGGAAAIRETADPENSFCGMLSLAGRSFGEPRIRQLSSARPWHLVPGEKGDVRVLAGSRSLPPARILGEILRKLRHTARQALGENVTRAVVAVPGSFTGAQRSCILDAGRIADLEITLISSASAAAIDAVASGSYRQDSRIGAVYSLGAGNFDFALFRRELQGGREAVRILAVSGSQELGGVDIDLAVSRRLAAQILRSCGTDILGSPHLRTSFLWAVEEAKKQLSSASSAQVILPRSLGFSGDLTLPLSRKELEAEAAGVVRRTEELMIQALNDAGLEWREVDQVILTGGQTLMPIVGGMFPDSSADPSHDPLTSAVRGAAIQAGILDGRVQGPALVDVLFHGLGIETGRGVMPVLPRNTPLPARKSFIITTFYDGQQSLPVHVIQGDGSGSPMESLATYSLEGIPPARRGLPRVEITMEVDPYSRLHVHAREQISGQKLRPAVHKSHELSPEESEAMCRESRAWEHQARRAEEAMLLAVRAREELTKIRSRLAEIPRGSALREAEQAAAAADALEAACQGTDPDLIRSRTGELAQAADALEKAMERPETGQDEPDEPENPENNEDGGVSSEEDRDQDASVRESPEESRETGSEEEPQNEIRRLGDELARCREELENLRKQAPVDVARARDETVEEFTEDLLGVADDLERALDSLGAGGAANEGNTKGVELILRSLQRILSRHGVEMLDPKGEHFDPATQNAVQTEESGDLPADTVIRVLQKGYVRKGRLLRPAMVVVSRRPAG